nr:MAG TPA: hypothetical protein [Crassvirales sp.]
MGRRHSQDVIIQERNTDGSLKFLMSLCKQLNSLLKRES